jgi:hypothetical protein
MSQNAEESLLEYFKILIEIDASPNLDEAENIKESETP